MLLDPFEEKFYLPAAFVKLRNCQRCEGKIVCQENEALLCFAVEVTDPTKRNRVILRSLWTLENNRLIAA